MTQTEEKTVLKGAVSEQHSEDTQFDQYHFEQAEGDYDLDLEEQYLNKLKIQRKRIQELSLLHLSNEERIQKQIEKNRGLREEIEKLSSMKEYQSRYNETIVSLESVTQDNKQLRDQMQDLRQELYQTSAQKGGVIQKLRLQISLLRDKESSKIEHLQQELSNKQQEIDKLARDNRLKQKQSQDIISSLRNKVSSLQNQHEEIIKSEQKKVQRLERELQTRSSNFNEAQINTDSLLKENAQLKEDNYRLNSLLNNRELQLKSQAQKFKIKFNSLKKQIKAKQKEASDYRESLRKIEKDVKEHSSQSQTLRIQIRRIKQITEVDKGRLESDFLKEKQNLQAIINQHVRTIEELLGIKNDLLAENKQMQNILKKKEAVEKQRRMLLKTELKEIDKLEKVIDKIVD